MSWLCKIFGHKNREILLDEKEVKGFVCVRCHKDYIIDLNKKKKK